MKICDNIFHEEFLFPLKKGLFMEKKQIIAQVNQLFKFVEECNKASKSKCYSHLRMEQSKQTIRTINREEFTELKKSLIESINNLKMD